MRILSRYLAKDFAVIFALTIAVFTLVMALGTIVRAMDWMARGVPGLMLLRYFGLSVPFSLQFTVPMGAITATLLLFSRLSMDGEIAAMKACGMSLWQIVAPVLLMAMGAALLTLVLAHEVSPRCRYLQRYIEAEFRDVDPMVVIEEGRWIRDFPGYLLFVSRRDGRRLQDVTLYEMLDRGHRRVIRARAGTLERSADGSALHLDLYNVRMEQTEGDDPGDLARVRSMTADHYPRVFPVSSLFRRREVRKRRSDVTLAELIEAVRRMPDDHPEIRPADLRPQQMRFVIEASNRTALAFTCLAFAMMGIPLGMRSRRRQSSIGVGIGLGFVALFYFVMVLTDSMHTQPAWRPELLTWIPILLAQGLGLVLIHRAR